MGISSYNNGPKRSLSKIHLQGVEVVAMNPMKFIDNLITKFLLFVILSVSFFPIFWMIFTSLKPEVLAFSIPPVLVFTPTLSNYISLFNPYWMTIRVDFMRYLVNSIVVSISSTALSSILSLFAAYSFTRFRFVGSKFLIFLILFMRMIPPITIAIPLYVMMYTLKLLDTHIALILTYTALNIPLTVWMMRSFIMDVPKEVEESALVDGCGVFQVLLRVTIPLALPGIITASIYAFILSWNEFLLALLLTLREATTLPLIAQLFRTAEGVQWGPMAAAGTLAILPPIVFAFLIQKYLVRGLTMGAVKG
jgi:multiple sugar transport system permease protein